MVAIGSATRDNFLKRDYMLIDWPETPLGKAMVLPLGEKLGVEEAYFTVGGNAVNAAITFARHGFKTACAAKVGIDLPAKELLARFKKEGVSTKHISQTDERPTAYSVLLLRGGERTILGYHGASDTFTLQDLNLKKLKAGWWYVSLAGESDKMYLELVRFAKEKNIQVAFNPSGHHIHHRKDEILASLKDIAILAVNAGEAAELTGISFHEEEKVFKKIDELMSPGIVVVTDAEKGVTVSDGKKIYKAGIFKEKKVADRTGAGDSFGSGFVATIARGGTIPEAIRFASANATSVIERIGATEGVLTREAYEGDERWKNFKIGVRDL